MNRLHARLDELQRQRAAVVVCTIVRTRGSVPRRVGAKMLVHADGSIEGTVGGGELEERVRQQALQVLAEGTARIVEHALVDPHRGDAGVCGGSVEVFLEPLTQKPMLVVIGAGHVGAALVHLGGWLGFHVVLADDRVELCTPEIAPGAHEYRAVDVPALSRQLTFTDDTWIVMPTRGMPVDVEGLPHLLARKFRYLGVIGSRRRWGAVRKQLLQRGVTAEQLVRVHAPMGLELEAETPEEIAVSVLAEILMIRNGGTGAPMCAPGVQADGESGTLST